MKTGCLRNTPLIAWPGLIAEISISVELSASTSADGAIWLISGTSVATTPTPAAETAAMLMKSRRRTPSPAACSGVAPFAAAGLASSAMIDLALLCLASAETVAMAGIPNSLCAEGAPPGACPATSAKTAAQNRFGALIDAKITPANRLFGLFQRRRSFQGDQRNLAAIGRLAGQAGAAIGVESLRGGKRIEPEPLDPAHPAEFEAGGDIALKVEMPVPWPPGSEIPRVARRLARQSGRGSRHRLHSSPGRCTGRWRRRCACDPRRALPSRRSRHR